MSSVSFRTLKSRLSDWMLHLEASELQNRLSEFPVARWVHPVVSLLYSQNEILFRKAVEICGWVVDRLWTENREDARNVIRRLFWSLNEESGGIGWGAAEALGAILARNEAIAKEYGRMLASLLRTQSSFIDHPRILQGILWAVGRVARRFPDSLGSDAAELIAPYLQSPDVRIQRLALQARQILQPIDDAKDGAFMDDAIKTGCL
ncbi:DVU0298 family protein [Desulfatirhabdium butyrativorans]|uniref:DVU0298 family protein n=1 Tax=Desulfatirhabdium butyrativorans TaxID=340467 RepID=UPI000410CD36|nr:DVU0298 family protein [Desulfatirhabdium butyrativorans]